MYVCLLSTVHCICIFQYLQYLGQLQLILTHNDISQAVVSNEMTILCRKITTVYSLYFVGLTL